MCPQYHQQQYANKLRIRFGHKGIHTMPDPHNKLYWICSVSFRIFLIEKEPSPPLKHAPQGSAWKSLNYLTPPSLNWRNLGPAWKNCWWTQGGSPLNPAHLIIGLIQFRTWTPSRIFCIPRVKFSRICDDVPSSFLNFSENETNLPYWESINSGNFLRKTQIDWRHITPAFLTA